jgi:hypothetical protein
MIKKILSFLFLIFLTNNIYAHIANLEKNELDLKLSYMQEFYSSFLDENGDQNFSIPELYALELRAYSAYGITDFLTVNLSIPFNRNNSGTNLDALSSGTQNKLGDIYIGTKIKLAEHQIDASFTFDIKIPGAYDEKLFQSPGNGNFDFIPGIIIGKSFFDKRLLLSFDSSYYFRYGVTGNALTLGSGLYLFLNPDFNIFACIKNFETITGINIADSNFDSTTLEYGYPAIDEDYTYISSGLSYNIINSLAISPFYYKTISGKNTVYGQGIGTVLSYSF